MPTANPGGTGSGDPLRGPRIEYGEFPFPLTNGPQESPYLTWLRNHSNYMAVRGFLDYLRSIGVLVRGIIVNFLIFLPYLLVVAIGLGYSHHAMLKYPFYGTLAGALALLSSSDKLLSVLQGAMKKVAVAVIGVVGVLVPLLVILLATDFLVYGVPPRPSVMFSPLLVAVAGVIVIICALPLGLWRRAFTRNEFAWVAGLLVAALIAASAVFAGGVWASNKNFAGTEDSLKKIINPLDSVAKEFAKIPKKQEMDQQVLDLIEQAKTVHRTYGNTLDDLKALAKQAKQAKQDPPNSGDANSDIDNPENDHAEAPHSPDTPRTAQEPSTNDDPESSDTWSNSLRNLFRVEQQTEGLGRQFESGQAFITIGNSLSVLPQGSLELLRDEVAKLAQYKLLEQLVEESKNREPDEPDLAEVLRKSFAGGQ